MSFLSILLVASAFYFAHARPDSQSWQPESSAPISDPADYQHQLYGFMEDISKTVDQYLTPLMSKLEKPKQDEMKNMGMNGFASYMNYLLMLIEEKKMEKEKSAYSEPHEDYWPRNEMMIQFDSPYPLDPDTPYIAETQHDDKEVAVE